MDFMNMTFAQVLALVEERTPELCKQFYELAAKVAEASEVREKASDSYEVDTDDITLENALNDANDNYWKLQDKFYELHLENDRLRDLARALKYVPDCKDLLDVAAIFVRN